MLRKIKKQVELYKTPIIVGLISIFLFYNFFGYLNLLNLSSNTDLLNFRIQLVATFLGVLLSIAIINANDNEKEYKRIKRTFGLLKLIAIPLLKNQAENLRDTIDILYKDICSFEQALRLFSVVSRLDSLAANFDKNWTQLIYSREFLDAPINDSHFNSISRAVFEQLLFIKTLIAQSNNAKNLIIDDISKLSKEQQEQIIPKAREIRDDLSRASHLLLKTVDDLDREVLKFLHDAGVGYFEVER